MVGKNYKESSYTHVYGYMWTHCIKMNPLKRDETAIIPRSERIVLTLLLDRKTRRWSELLEELVQTKVLSQGALATALGNLVKNKDIIRKEDKGAKEYPHPVTYSINEPLREDISERLEYHVDLEWPDGLSPLVKIVEGSNESLADKRQRLRDIFDHYELEELEAIKDQMMWAAYSKLRGDHFAFGLLRNAAKRNFAKYAQTILDAIDRNEITAYAFLSIMGERHEEMFKDMIDNTLDRQQIFSAAEPRPLRYDVLRDRLLEPLEHLEPKKTRQENEKQYRWELSELAERACYLT
jgi:predicted transcriptional regulator